MRFVPIAPISLQSSYDRPVLFALAHMLKDAEYSEFFRNACKYTYCILDNGAYEGKSLSIQELMYLTKHYGFKEVALPDKLRDDVETYQLTGRAMKDIFSKYSNLISRDVQFMIVPQGSTILKWAVCAQMLIEEYVLLFPNRRFTVGVPKVTSRLTGGRGVILEKYLIPLQEKFKFDIHLLGIAESMDALRSIALRYGPNIRTVDSARPFIWAKAETQISVIHEPTNYPGRFEGYFESEFTPLQTMLAESNVSAYERMCLYDGQLTY